VAGPWTPVFASKRYDGHAEFLNKYKKAKTARRSHFSLAKSGESIINNHNNLVCMYYVYLLRSIAFPNMTYVGYTIDLKQRFSDHNTGKSPHTSKFKPWQLVCYFSFNTKPKAIDFERYLKSSSGRSFSKKHFW
jgi:predicted GIY-YIG superfamily endonuclease